MMPRRATGAPGRPGVVALAVTTGLAVLLQIAYPLTHSTPRQYLTIAIVVAFAAACVLHAAATRGVRRAVLFLVSTALTGYLIELVGVHTGFPFGSYRYCTVLGPQVFGVPLVVGLAWTMLCWPAALAARRLATGTAARVLLGAWAVTAGDFFLDPQMVAAGAWTWRDRGLHLPGVLDVPLSNFGGWLLVSVVLSAVAQRLIGDGPDGWGVGLYLWFWVAWTLALVAFLGLPAAGLWGALAMGTVAVPLAVTVRRAGPPRQGYGPARRTVERCAQRMRAG